MKTLILRWYSAQEACTIIRARSFVQALACWCGFRFVLINTFDPVTPGREDKMMTKLNATLAAVAALAGSAVVADTADAALMVKFDDGVNAAVTITDGDSADNSVTDGIVSVSRVLGNFDISSSVGVEGDFLQAPGALLLNSTVTSLGAPGTLTISLTVTDLTSPIGTFDSIFEAAGISGGTVDVRGYVDSTNAAFGTETFVGGLVQNSSGTYETTIPSTVTTADPFSVTIVAVVEHDGVSTSTVNSEVGIVPEPSSLALLGLGGLLVARRRRG